MTYLQKSVTHQYSTPPPPTFPAPWYEHSYQGAGKKNKEYSWPQTRLVEKNLEENLFDFLSIYLFHIHVFIHLFVCLLLAQRNWR